MAILNAMFSWLINAGYLHTADDARHRETEEKHRIGW
jgi:hypothetical protein